MSLPKFCVVVPVFNKAPHIRKCLDSVLRQTFTQWELVIVDDSSDDGSFEIAEGYAHHQKIRVERRDAPGPGGYAARNHGAQLATATWIAFLDADDYWNPEHLRSLAALAETFPKASIISSPYLEEANGVATPVRAFAQPPPRDPEQISHLDYIRDLASNRPRIWTSALAVNSDIFRQSGGFPAGTARKGGDVLTWLKLLQHGDAVLTRLPTAVYVRDAVNTVTGDHEVVPEILMQEIAAAMSNSTSDDETRALLCYHWRLTRTWVLRAGRRAIVGIPSGVTQRIRFRYRAWRALAPFLAWSYRWYIKLRS